MMQQLHKSDLRSAFVLLKCSKQSHNDCRKIRDALIDKFPNIQEAYTTNAEVDGEQWCVAASALVDVKDEKKFEKELWKLTAEGKKPITIGNLKLIVDNQ